jgi:hypothetical protein
MGISQKIVTQFSSVDAHWLMSGDAQEMSAVEDTDGGIDGVQNGVCRDREFSY